jgi:hypothetical protein
LSQPKDEVHEITSSVLGKGMNPNYSPQCPPIGLRKIRRGKVFTLNFKMGEGYYAY